MDARCHPAVGNVSGGTEDRPARLIRDEETGEPFRVPCCPDCTAQIVDKDGVPLTDADLNRRKHVWRRLPRSPLVGRQVRAQARYPLADYVKHRMKGFFDLLVSGTKSTSSRGEARPRASPPASSRTFAASPSACPGTLLGGYSSTHLPPALPVLARRSGRSSVAPTSTAGYSGTASRRSPSASPMTTLWRTGATAAAASSARW